MRAAPGLLRAEGAALTAREVRARARRGLWRGTTRGAAPGHVQCNVVILAAGDAERFAGWCERNPTVAPVLARSDPGDPRLPALGAVDLRYDLPAYRAFAHGSAVGELGDLADRWTDDLVGFAFGCSFSLEDALRSAGVPLRYEQRGFGGAIYRTAIATQAHAGFAAPMIVSMRPFALADADRAVEVSRHYPQLHGAPMHVGGPELIGVALDEPLESIGAIGVQADEVPVFWACGVTTQWAIEHARPSLAYTHVSSQMLVTDLRLDDLHQRAA